MYTKEQKERALKEFERLGSVQAVVTLLGYPSRHTLYDWYRNKIADIADYHGSLDKEYQIKQKYINAPNHPRNPDANLKLDAIKRCFSLGEGVEYVSRDIGYSRASIYSWYRKYQKFGVAGLMSSKKQIKRENIDFNTEPSKQQEMVAGILADALVFQQLAHPGQTLVQLVVAAQALLVLPVCGNAVLGLLVHGTGARSMTRSHKRAMLSPFLLT